MDTNIDKPLKRPVPRPITGQFPKRGANGQFLPGTVGNPKGRPRGTRNRAGLLMEDLLDGRAKALTEKAIEKALTGDVFALREPALPPAGCRFVNNGGQFIRLCSPPVPAIK